jgi:hypothetical protein
VVFILQGGKVKHAAQGVSMLKKSIGLIFTLLFAWYGVGSAQNGSSDKPGDSEVLLFSYSSRFNLNAPAAQTSDPGTNKSQNSSGFELNSALEYSNPSGISYYATLRYEPFNELLTTTQTNRIMPVYSQSSASETESRNLVDIPELRPGPLFIAEAVKKGPHRIPEFSTLLLLGLVLVGLAGYGGRKKFKR